MRTTAIVSTVLLSASLVAGCGSSGDNGKSASGGSYCNQLKAAKSDFSSFNSASPDLSKFDDAIATLHKLADEAPSPVKDDWKTLDDALNSMEKALSDAGLKMSDLSKITAGQLPEGMTAAELQEVAPKLQSAFSGLDSDKVTKATSAIESHAKSVCKVNLSD